MPKYLNCDISSNDLKDIFDLMDIKKKLENMKSKWDLKQKMEKGQITVDMVTESFKRATSEGGKFFNGASNTL